MARNDSGTSTSTGTASAASGLRIVPANEASWEDLELILGKARCHGGACYCQRFKAGGAAWEPAYDEARAFRLRGQTSCGDPESEATSGLVAYADDEPAGWCNVEPRTAFPGLPASRVAWKARGEDKDDAGVWAVTCFITRTEFRRTGITHALAAAAVEFARERGARALEAYPMVTEPGKEITWGELHVGSRGAFADAGFREVAHPTPRRVVMRIDF
ncbi:GNAT family N-acetyltransferase [Actinospica robiniae]|uniref:GNAT family N-acetyltransferase n=1 Tax=Actinospica robiniae TaxID=304901 RepID=UPI000423F7FA|nr:GNAT family N-acetyltransferase [Actinospica robiniae]